MSHQPPSKENIIDIKSVNALGLHGFWLHIIKYLKQKAVGSCAKVMQGKKDDSLSFWIYTQTYIWVRYYLLY